MIEEMLTKRGDMKYKAEELLQKTEQKKREKKKEREKRRKGGTERGREGERKKWTMMKK